LWFDSFSRKLQTLLTKHRRYIGRRVQWLLQGKHRPDPKVTHERLRRQRLKLGKKLRPLRASAALSEEGDAGGRNSPSIGVATATSTLSPHRSLLHTAPPHLPLALLALIPSAPWRVPALVVAVPMVSVPVLQGVSQVC
jgi:hypothetical protein